MLLCRARASSPASSQTQLWPQCSAIPIVPPTEQETKRGRGGNRIIPNLLHISLSDSSPLPAGVSRQNTDGFGQRARLRSDENKASQVKRRPQQPRACSAEGPAPPSFPHSSHLHTSPTIRQNLPSVTSLVQSPSFGVDFESCTAPEPFHRTD